MIIQIINLSLPEVFSTYSAKYKIRPEVYSHELLGLELRDISSGMTSEFMRIFLRKNELFYKFEAYRNGTVDLFIEGSLALFKKLSRNILYEGHKEIGNKINDVIKNYEEYNHIVYKIAGKEFSFDNPYVMGILNVTPDSFSDGGKYFDKNTAVNYGLQLLGEGAHILDIGGESTRPGAKPVSEDEELNRVLPVINNILALKSDAVISVDTTKSLVAEEALKSGAQIINDVSGLTSNPGLLNVVRRYNASIIIMHMKGTPETMQLNPEYDNLIQEIYDFLFIQSQTAVKAGVSNIFIDPGIGFGKSVDHNFEIIKRIGDFKSLGFPLVIGNSRKSFIGKTLNIEPEERDAASAFVNAVSITRGAKIIRTHNVKYSVQCIKLINKIY
ncbi:MAG: dihydropteroate synthase [Ignavibacteriaceae bacterium]|nr:dihydropteroate synthase [Ignavibacteriaceae bacterium]